MLIHVEAFLPSLNAKINQNSDCGVGWDGVGWERGGGWSGGGLGWSGGWDGLKKKKCGLGRREVGCEWKK